MSSLDKVMYPATGTTKMDVLQHYISVADRVLPLLAARPVTRVRWPHGVDGTHFFEKNMPSGAPDWLPSVKVHGHGWGSRSSHASVTYPLVEHLAHLIYLVNLGSLELHVPQWRIGSDGLPQPPDRLVIDLDPGPGAGLAECAEVALLVREHVEGTGLDLTPVTSGSKGMQLYAELEGQRDAAEVSGVAKALAQHLATTHPHLVVWRMTKSLRAGKVFLDWSQNSAAKTTICPWSLRGRERPTVATPRRWEEVEQAAERRSVMDQVSLDEVGRYLG
ncbi:MAG: non-homologous end-joining DNA ligase [Ornithinimicrobium sp.]